MQLPPHRDTRIFWTAEEYKMVARALAPQYPKAMEGHLPGLSITDLNLAIRAALPTERQRRMANQAHITSFERRLRDAVAGKSLWTVEQFDQAAQQARQDEERQVAESVARLRAEGADWRNGPRVLWTGAEWDELLTHLYEVDPTLEARKDWLTTTALNAAAARMKRPRTFYSITAARRHLEDARLRRAARRAQEARAQAAPTAPAAPSMQRAPAPAAEAVPVLVRPPDPAPSPASVTEAAERAFCKVTWTREEWLAIARELHRLHAIENYPYRANLVGLDSEDVAFAQERVLPFERQRRHVRAASFSTLRTSLERAFADLRAQLEAETALEAAPAPAAEAPPAPAAGPADVPAPPAVPFPVFGTPETAAVDPYRAAFAPLVALLAAEVAKQLQPMVTQAVADALAKLPTPALAMPAPPAVLTPALAALPAKNYGDGKPEVEKPKKITVGILVNRQGTYKAELEKTFPMIEIRLGDVSATHAADRIANCDKVFCMTRWVDHVASGRLKKLAKERYAPCNGAMAELKRMIGLWLTSEGIKVNQAT